MYLSWYQDILLVTSSDSLDQSLLSTNIRIIFSTWSVEVPLAAIDSEAQWNFYLDKRLKKNKRLWSVWVYSRTYNRKKLVERKWKKRCLVLGVSPGCERKESRRWFNPNEVSSVINEKNKMRGWRRARKGWREGREKRADDKNVCKLYPELQYVPFRWCLLSSRLIPCLGSWTNLIFLSPKCYSWA